jgi:hypothetical protein
MKEIHSRPTDYYVENEKKEKQEERERGESPKTNSQHARGDNDGGVVKLEHFGSNGIIHV